MPDLLQQLFSVLASPAAASTLPPSMQPVSGSPPRNFAIPNVHSNFDPRTGQFLGAQTADADIPLPARRPAPAAPALPMQRPNPGVPPPPMRRPEPQGASVPLPLRRPGMPNVPGITVDMATGGGDLVSQLRQVFGAVPTAAGMNPQRVFDGVGGPAQGTPQPPAAEPSSNIQTASIGPFETTAAPAESGPSVTGKDVASFFRNLARGAATADPTAPPLSAFSQGMAGSMVGMDKESREAAAAEAAGEDREFERRMKTTDARLRQSKDQREARSAEIQNTKLVTEIMNNLDPGLTKDQKFRLRRDLIQAAARMRADSSYMKDDEMKAALETIVSTVDEQMNTGQPQGGAAPSQFQEGQTATGPNGQKIIFRGGRWQPLG